MAFPVPLQMMAGIATASGPEQADFQLTLVFAAAAAAAAAVAVAAAAAAAAADAADWTYQQQQQDYLPENKRPAMRSVQNRC